MKPGDTFITADPSTARDTHLWVIVSDPAQDEDRIVILNLTTAAKHHDKTCILVVGDHPFITRESAVNYGQGYVLSRATLGAQLNRRRIENREPVTAAVLQRIRDGAGVSPHLPFEQYKILSEQGII